MSWPYRIRLVKPDNAPCCFLIKGVRSKLDRERAVPGDASKYSLLVQTDWDFPSVAGSFGWSLRSVQWPNRSKKEACDHSGTDGTIKCPDCGIDAGSFIAAARTWMLKHDGKVADNPGYNLEKHA